MDEIEYEDAWLEVRSSAKKGGTPVTIDTAPLLADLPVISEVLEIAVQTNASMKDKNSEGLWDYSRRLALEEAEKMLGTGLFGLSKKDSRSLSFSLDVFYKGSYYALTLLMEIRR